MTDKEHAAGQEVKTSPGETASGPVSAASPFDHPGIRADLRRQIREERRELVELDALRWAWARDRLAIEDIERMNDEVPLMSTNIDAEESAKTDAAIDAILAREGGKQ